MSTSQIKNITIAGASGNLGSSIVHALLTHPHPFTLTALTRSSPTSSSSTFPAGVHTKAGSYDDPSFLVSALRGQDVLIIALAFTAPPDQQSKLIAAAAEAGVPWVVPTEFGSDSENQKLGEVVPVFGHKRGYRREIEGLGVSSWIGIACNPWFDFSLSAGLFGIDIPSRKATLYDAGTLPITTTTIAQTSRALAGVLALPAPELQTYRNAFAFVQSFSISQKEILAAVQKVTGTTDEEWDVMMGSAEEVLKLGRERVGKGDMGGVVQLIYGATFTKGLGDRFYGEGRELVNEKVGLPVEDVEEEVRKVVEKLEKKD